MKKRHEEDREEVIDKNHNHETAKNPVRVSRGECNARMHHEIGKKASSETSRRSNHVMHIKKDQHLHQTHVDDRTREADTYKNSKLPHALNQIAAQSSSANEMAGVARTRCHRRERPG